MKISGTTVLAESPSHLNPIRNGVNKNPPISDFCCYQNGNPQWNIIVVYQSGLILHKWNRLKFQWAEQKVPFGQNLVLPSLPTHLSSSVTPPWIAHGVAQTRITTLIRHMLAFRKNHQKVWRYDIRLLVAESILTFLVIILNLVH
jgi:hypothetical protein